MADLNSLMSVAPGTAAFFMGQNQRQNSDMEAMRQQELQQLIAARMQKAQQDAQMGPLELEHHRLTNQGLEAGLPGIIADSKTKGLTAASTEATQPGTIAATNAGNDEKVAASEDKNRERYRNFLTEASVELGSTPAPQRMQALLGIMQSNGINPNKPQVQVMIQQLQQMDPNTWAKHFATVADQLGSIKASQNPAYRSALETAASHERASKYTADQHLAGTKYSSDAATNRAKIVAERKAALAGDLLTRVKSGQVPPDKAAVQFNMLATLAEDPAEQVKYNTLAKQMELLVYNKAIAGRTGDPTIGSGGELGTRPAPTPVLGGDGPPPGSAANPIKLD